MLPGSDVVERSRGDGWNAIVTPGMSRQKLLGELARRIGALRPDRGIVRTFIEVLNQRREIVMSMKMVNFVRCREAPAG